MLFLSLPSALSKEILNLSRIHLRAIVTTTFQQQKWTHLLAFLTQYRSHVMGHDYKWSGFPLPCLAVAKYCSKEGTGAMLKDVVEDLACDVNVAEYIHSDFRYVYM